MNKMVIKKVSGKGVYSAKVKTTKTYANIVCSKKGFCIELSDEPGKKGFCRVIESCSFVVPKQIADTYFLSDGSEDTVPLIPDSEKKYVYDTKVKVTRLPKTGIVQSNRDISYFSEETEKLEEFKSDIIGSNDFIDMKSTTEYLHTVRIYNENRVMIITQSTPSEYKLPNAFEFRNEVNRMKCPFSSVMYTAKSNIKIPEYFRELCNSPSYIVRRFSNGMIMVHPYNIKDEILDTEIDVLNEKTETIKVSDEALAIKDNIAALINFFDNMSQQINSNTQVFETVYKETMEKFHTLNTVIDVATNQAKLAFQEMNKAINKNSRLEEELSEKEKEVKFLQKELKKADNKKTKQSENNIGRDVLLSTNDFLELN